MRKRESETVPQGQRSPKRVDERRQLDALHGGTENGRANTDRLHI